jgi:hypothetical protein
MSQKNYLVIDNPVIHYFFQAGNRIFVQNRKNVKSQKELDFFTSP